MKCFGSLCCVLLLSASQSWCNERIFTYTYEPETMPAHAWEAENWLTWRAGRNAAVGQEHYNLWEFRQSAEYGVTDDYTVEFYVNSSLEGFHDPSSRRDFSDFRWDGISIENRYMVLNPANHKVGLTLYLEPRISDTGAEVEQKIILGQRYGKWKWALNLTHSTEWSSHFRKTEGEVEASFGLARELGKHWALGIEVRDHNELPDYSKWENTAVYIGPALSYHRGRWWAALSVMPQIYGANFIDNPDRNHHLDLEGHERVNTRLIFGFSF